MIKRSMVDTIGINVIRNFNDHDFLRAYREVLEIDFKQKHNVPRFKLIDWDTHKDLQLLENEFVRRTHEVGKGSRFNRIMKEYLSEFKEYGVSQKEIEEKLDLMFYEWREKVRVKVDRESNGETGADSKGTQE